MKIGPGLAAGVAAGYVLGRTKKMRLALTVAAVGITGRFGVRPSELVLQGLKELASSEVGRAVESARGEVGTLVRDVATNTAKSRIDQLSSRLTGGVGAIGDREGLDEPDEEEEDEPDYAEDDDEERGETAGRDEEDEEADQEEDGEDEDEDEQRETRRRPVARRTSSRRRRDDDELVDEEDDDEDSDEEEGDESEEEEDERPIRHSRPASRRTAPARRRAPASSGTRSRR